MFKNLTDNLNALHGLRAETVCFLCDFRNFIANLNKNNISV